MKQKTQKMYRGSAFGFPIRIHNAPMVQEKGRWQLDTNQKGLQKNVVRALVHKRTRLTGAEIRFVRQYFGMTLQEFGRKFDVTHPAVKKWEDQGHQPTEMRWTTEKDIRLFCLTQLSGKPREFMETYKELEQKVPAKPGQIEVQANF